MLNKKGNSHGDERMDLLDRFYDIFPNADVAYLTGDREFVGKQWLTYQLIEPTIPFRLRIRKSAPPALRKPQRIGRSKQRSHLRRKQRPSSFDYLRKLKTRLNQNFIWSSMGVGTFSLYFSFTFRRS